MRSAMPRTIATDLDGGTPPIAGVVLRLTLDTAFAAAPLQFSALVEGIVAAGDRNQHRRLMHNEAMPHTGRTSSLTTRLAGLWTR